MSKFLNGKKNKSGPDPNRFGPGKRKKSSKKMDQRRRKKKIKNNKNK